MKLTDTFVARLTNPAKETTYWDDDPKGFGLRVQPTGAKSFVVQYRTPGGRKGVLKKVTIGRYGSPWTITTARAKAKQVLASVIQGGDPAALRRQTRTAPTVAELCDTYLQEGCTTKAKGTLKADESRIKCHIKPLLGRMLIHEVKRADVERMIADIATGRTKGDHKTAKLRGRSIITGGQGAATRTARLLGGIFTFAIDRELRETNPVKGVRLFADKKGERFLSEREWGRLGEALRGHEAVNPTACTIIRLISLTGARRSEINDLTWDEVDGEGHCLRLKDSKTGARIVPVGSTVISILEEIRPQDAHGYVFPAPRGAGPYRGLERAWQAIRKAASLDDVRLHDLRHSYASWAARAGHTPWIIAAMVGHSDVRMTERYVHTPRSLAGQAADQVSTLIRDMVA